MDGSESNGVVLAAGGILTRPSDTGYQVAVITRDRHTRGECALPKGKVRSSDATPEAAALREVLEETGCRATLGDFVGVISYPSTSGLKVVLFWLMDFVRAEGVLDHEEAIGVEWLDPAQAVIRLTHPQQRELLACVVASRRLSGQPSKLSGLRRRLLRRDPQLVRLREAVADLESELANATRSPGATHVAQAREHASRAWQAVEEGDTDTGWGQVYRARELQVLDLDADAVHRAAVEVDAEVRTSGKFNAWRREAISGLLAPVLDPPAEPTPDEQSARRALCSATRLRHDAFSNEYRGITILRRHQQRLLIIGAAALAVAVGLILTGGAGFSTAQSGEGWVLGASVAMGVVGAVTSAAQRTTAIDKARIPQQLSSNVASFSRIPIGSVAGLLVWLGSFTGVAPAEHAAAYVLMAAFGAGFTERLVAPSSSST
jgi:8-oxo-dGTP pyrophosphatase MutT (NUDIX family)